MSTELLYWYITYRKLNSPLKRQRKEMDDYTAFITNDSF